MSKLGLYSNRYTLTIKYATMLNKFLFDNSQEGNSVSTREIQAMIAFLSKLNKDVNDDFKMQLLYATLESFYRKKKANIDIDTIVSNSLGLLKKGDYQNEKLIKYIRSLATALNVESDKAYFRIKRR